MHAWIAAHWHIGAWFTAASTLCSILHTFLPPWDWKPKIVEEGLSEFPGLQKIFYATFHNRYYRLLIYTVGYLAIAQRSNFWKSLSINNPQSVNASVATVVHAANVELREGQ